MLFSRQVYRTVLPFPVPKDLPDPGAESASPLLAGGFFTTELPANSLEMLKKKKKKLENNDNVLEYIHSI